MKFLIRKMLLLIGFLIPHITFAQYYIKDKNAIPLDGTWSFAMDPQAIGEKLNWYKKATKTNWDKVTVPHCFSVDNRFLFYIGKTWYKRNFNFTKNRDKRTVIHFDGAYYLTEVFVNDKKIGIHEGGYTPFSFDITDALQNGENTIAISVDNNTWNKGTIPGAKDEEPANSSFTGWMNYGGLNRPVYITVEPKAYLKNIRVVATPDLKSGTARLNATAYVDNTLKVSDINPPVFSVERNGKKILLQWKAKNKTEADGMLVYEAEALVHKKDVSLWNLDQPTLYKLDVIIKDDTATTNFGIRKFEVKNIQLLLNGKPIKVGGANRVVDYPGLGALEPDSLIEKDFKLMKQGGMVFQRLTHYPPSEYFYDLADKYGMLIITEAGNWQLAPSQMADEKYRIKFKAQFVEMMQRDWNHPSIFAYSVGNEYNAKSAEGQSWTKDMIAFGKQLDPSRLFTFATLSLNGNVQKPEDEASQYCDFVSTNTYGNHAKILDNIHRLHPNKPIFISEWGNRADHATEAGQVKHIQEVAQIIRERPYIVGASWWSYNDYQSRHVGTNPNGYRPWGLVKPDRSLRPSYLTHSKEMSPITLKVIDKKPESITLEVHNRSDFPYLYINDYTVKTGADEYKIATLKPGENKKIVIKLASGKSTDLQIITPTKFTIYQEIIFNK